MILVVWTMIARAQTVTNSLPENLPLIPENTKLWTESLLWQQDVNLRTGAGYRDNVLLSPTNAQGSPFLTAGLDYSLLRLPLDGLGFDFFITGDSLRYLRNVPTDGEDFWVISATVKKYFGGNWEAGLEARESYVDEVQYALLNTGVNAVEVRGNFLNGRPFIRRDLGSNWWLQLDFNGAREIIKQPIGNDWRYGPKLTLGFVQGQNTKLDLSYELSLDDYDTLPVLAAGGTSTTASTLFLWQHTAELRWQQDWDAARRWSTDTKFDFSYESDNGSGYFNFYEYSIFERVRYETKHWQIAATARAAWQDFPVQQTDITSGPLLNILTLRAGLHVERRLTRWLKLYAEYSYEHALSNQSDDEYSSNTVTAGASWEF